MKNLNTNLKQSTNYLVELFYKTNRKYTCTRTKIGKLLSIASFKYAMEDKKLFNEDILKYNDSGTIILELNFVLDKNVYIKNEYFDNNEKIEEKDLILEEVRIPSIYLNTEKITKEVKNTLKEVFLEFGAYTNKELSKLLDEITDIEGILYNDNIINLERIKEIDFEKIMKDKNSRNNSVLKYLNQK